MGNILSRIQEIAVKEGITITAMERSIGASKGVLSRAIANGTDIQSKWLQNIVENYPLYSADWLITGRGSMLRHEPTSTNSAPTASLSINNDFVSIRRCGRFQFKEVKTVTKKGRLLLRFDKFI